MNRTDARNLLIVLRDAYPTWRPDIGAVVDTWANVLHHINPADALAAAEHHIANSSYPPSPAEILQAHRAVNPEPGYYDLRHRPVDTPPSATAPYTGPEPAEELAKMRTALAAARKRDGR